MKADPIDGVIHTITSRVGAWMLDAIRRHMPDEQVDVLSYDVQLYPMPSDSGWIPSVFIYLMLQPVGDVDGEHEGQWTSPYLLTQETVDGIVRVFADRTAEKRQELRQARQEGKQPTVGVAVSDVTG